MRGFGQRKLGGDTNVREMEMRLLEEKPGGEVGGVGRRKLGGEVFQLGFPLQLLHGYERTYSMHCCTRNKRKLPDISDNYHSKHFFCS